MDHHSAGLPQGDGGDPEQAAGCRKAQGFGHWVRAALSLRRSRCTKEAPAQVKEGRSAVGAPREGTPASKEQPPANDVSPGATFSSFKGEPEAPSTAHVSATICTTISFRNFAASLPRWVLRSRTKFAAYLAASFSAPSHRSGRAPPSALFPLPLPYLGVFAGSGPHLPQARWHRLAQRRLLCVVVLALNFVHEGYRRPSEALLWRLPNAHQRSAYARLMKLIQACDRQGEAFPLPPGRSGFEFVARLLELEAFAAQACLGSASLYGNTRATPGPSAVAPQIEPSSALPQLHPYRSLDTSRLKLSGQGRWDMSAWLSGPLWLPFQEPAILHHHGPLDPAAVPSFEHEDRAENLKLARLWDCQGLLRLFEGSPPSAGRCRVFNAFKDAERDRQIGDRRLVNGAEMHHQGPSAWLPSGTVFLAFELPKHSHRVVAYISDRKDYYHQARVTQSRARSNCLPFAFSGAELSAIGIDRCPFGSPRPILVPGRSYTPAFGSLFQGDHLGVEFALESHKQMLHYYGALPPELSLLNRQPAPLGDTAQALVIDDFVSASVIPSCAPASSSRASVLHGLAQEAHLAEGVPGSPEKDVLGSDCFQAIGAEIDSGLKNRSAGLATCGAPLSRRISLASLSLRAAALPVTSGTFCARAAGAWVSVCLYRRCTMIVFNEVFRLAQQAGAATSAQTVVRQSRSLAQELVLASIFAPLCVSDLTARTLPTVFATDASLGLGAGCSAQVPPEVARTLWLNADRRGGYSRLDQGPRLLLRALGEAPCEEDVAEDSKGQVEVPRQPSFRIDVLLVGRPSPALSAEARRIGLHLSPALNPGVSEHFDLRSPDFLLWLQTSIEAGVVRAILLLPRVGACRPFVARFGREATTRAQQRACLDVVLLSRYAACLRLAASKGIPCLLVAPSRLDGLCLPAFRDLVARDDVTKWQLDLCQYGWHSRQRYLCFGAHLRQRDLQRKCLAGCGCSPFKAPGPSDPLYGGLAVEVAEVFFKALRASHSEVEKPGIESVLVNDILSAAPWKVEFVVPWRGRSHINTLELGAIGILDRQIARVSPHSRFTVLVDSSVAKAASAKGRSTALALQPGLRRAMAHQLAFSLFPAFGFAPTRLNIADDPTRRTTLREPASVGLYRALPLPVLHNCGRLRLRRPLSSWARLLLVVVASWLSPSNLCSGHLRAVLPPSSTRPLLHLPSTSTPLLAFLVRALTPAMLDFFFLSRLVVSSKFLPLGLTWPLVALRAPCAPFGLSFIPACSSLCFAATAILPSTSTPLLAFLVRAGFLSSGCSGSFSAMA